MTRVTWYIEIAQRAIHHLAGWLIAIPIAQIWSGQVRVFHENLLKGKGYGSSVLGTTIKVFLAKF